MLRSINSSRLSSRTLMFSPVMHCYCRFYVTPGYSPLSINYISFISYDHRRDAGGESSLWPSGGCQVVSWSNSRQHDPNNKILMLSAHQAIIHYYSRWITLRYWWSSILSLLISWYTRLSTILCTIKRSVRVIVVRFATAQPSQEQNFYSRATPTCSWN